MNESGDPQPPEDDPTPPERASGEEGEATSPPPPPSSPPPKQEPHESDRSERPASRRLERSRRDRVLAGVCGGLAEYLNVDSVLVRIAALLLVFAGGAGLVLYVVGWIVMPDAPDQPSEEAEPTQQQVAPTPPRREEHTRGALFLGLLFVVLGAFFLVDAIWPDFLQWRYIWPIALIAIGAAVLVRARR